MADFNVVKYFRMLKSRVTTILLLMLALVIGSFYFMNKMSNDISAFIDKQNKENKEYFLMQSAQNEKRIDSIITKKNAELMKNQSKTNSKLNEIKSMIK